MTFTFLHIGDTHLDSRHARNPDRVSALEQIVARARALGPDRLAAVIWPGDLFDGLSGTEDRLTIADVVEALAGIAPVLIVPGNHDAPRDLEIFGRIRCAHAVLVAQRPGVVLFSTIAGDVRCFALPYVFKSALVGLGVQHADLGAAAAALLDPLFLTAAEELRECTPPDIPLMAMHLNVGGARSSVGQPQIGREIELTPALLDRLPPGVPILANHIHLQQTVGRVVYAGSIARMDYGETDVKGVLEWTYDAARRAWLGWEFRPLLIPDQFSIEGRLTRQGFTPAAPLPDVRGADVRVRYHFVKAEIGVLDVAHIHAAVAGCRHLKLEGIPELEQQVRAPEIAAALTLEEKVTRCAALQGVAVTPGLLDKLSSIQNQDADAILGGLSED